MLEQPDPDVEHASLRIAADVRPGLDVAAQVRRLDELSEPLRAHLPSAATPDEQARLLADHVYGALQFRGNGDDYYDPDNSYLDRVLERRLGIPLTLAIVLMAVGRRTGIPVAGVGFPGHFLARIGGAEGLLVDPFDGGRVLAEADLHRLAHRFLGDASRLRPRHLQPVETASMVTRMLTNLIVAHRRRGEVARALLFSDRLVELHPTPERRRDRGLIALQCGSHATATEDLQAYLQARPQAPDRAQIERALRHCRQAAGGSLQ